jgi:hypothetical protein
MPTEYPKLVKVHSTHVSRQGGSECVPDWPPPGSFSSVDLFREAHPEDNRNYTSNTGGDWFVIVNGAEEEARATSPRVPPLS